MEIFKIINQKNTIDIEDFNGNGDIPEGQRNSKLTSYAGKLRHKGASKDEIYKELIKINYNKCSPPLDEKEVETIAESVSRYPTGKENRSQLIMNIKKALESNDPMMKILDNENLLKEIRKAKNNDIAGYSKIKNLLKGKVNLNDLNKALSNVKKEVEHPSVDDIGNKYPIDITVSDLEQHRRESWQAVKKVNDDDPFIYQRINEIVRVVKDAKNNYNIKPHDIDSLRNIMADISFYHTIKSDGEHESIIPTYPPIAVIKALLAEDNPPIPALRRLVNSPVFSKGGELMTEPGYHSKSETYLIEGLDIPQIPSQICKDDVIQAKEFIKENILVDFPFTNESSIAYSFAALLLPFVRDMVDGPTPLHIFDAISGPGSGKTLLASSLQMIFTGSKPSVITDCRREEEWRKKITAELMTAPNAVLIDNVRGKIDSGALSSAITTSIWKDRKLQESRMIKVPVDNIWMATGNNIQTSKEISRRMVKIKLNAEVTRPWMRDPDKFAHPNLKKWIRENRKYLVRSCLIIIKGWIESGMPEGKESLGMFESWASIIGGILRNAEISGFLKDLDEMYEEVDSETKRWTSFIEVWKDKKSFNAVNAKILHKMAKEDDLLMETLGTKSERSQKIRLGKALKEKEGRVFGGYKIVRVNTQGKGGTNRYKLQNA